MRSLPSIRHAVFILAFGFLLLFSHGRNEVETPAPRVPAEFEAQESVWLAWPVHDNQASRPLAPLTCELIRLLEPSVRVDLLVPDAEWEETARATLIERNGQVGQVRFHQIEYEEPWLRDMGPVFAMGENGLHAIDFNFNGWGVLPADDPYCLKEEQVDRAIAAHLGLPNVMTRLIGEGGNREFNGRGTLMVVESTELQRNPNRTREQLEAEYRRLFGVRKVIWLPHHLYEDDLATRVYPGPDGAKAYSWGVGHCDEVARFVSADTILLAEVTEAEAGLDPFAKENRRRLEEVYQHLIQETDQDGHPFKIVRIPAALSEYVQLQEGDYSYDVAQDLEYEDGTAGHEGRPAWWVPAKSYTNFLISNGVVLTPRYWRPGRPELEQEKDREAVRVLSEIFPGRRIETVDAELILGLNVGGGGIHCITAQQPAIAPVVVSASTE